MPPKKKSKRGSFSPKPGLSRQYLMEHFTAVPANHEELKNGHVLLSFISNDHSWTNVVQDISNKIPGILILQHQVVSLVSRSLHRFKNLARDAEMVKFKEICNEVFPVHHSPSSRTDPPTSMSDEPTSPQLEPTSTVENTPSASTSESINLPQLRGDVSTPRKLKMRRRLEFMAKSRSEMKQKHAMEIKLLREQLRLRKGVKYLNQCLKRKDEIIERKKSTIRILRHELKTTKWATELEETTFKLARLIKKHRRMKQSNKNRRLTTVSKKLHEDDHTRLSNLLTEKDDEIRFLENETLCLKESITNEASVAEKKTKKDEKTFSLDIRQLVYDSIINQVPTKNIPVLIRRFAMRFGVTITAVPHRNTVEQMARELGVIAELQTAEVAMTTKNLTLGFDATTQEGVHINSIHLTTKTKCFVVAIDQLPGGTAEDYAEHVTSSINELAKVYSAFHSCDYQDCRKSIISNISNVMTDRAVVNHAAIQRISESWGKPLNELNCHLHPIDTIASACRAALKTLETSKGHVFGKDCMAANIVLQMNKLRYKDGKGDPRGFRTFLEDVNLPRGLLPRYRGNRLHVLFHLCGKYAEHYELFEKFLRTGTVSCGGLLSALHKDFTNPTAKLEIQVLGLNGKLLSGPWMKKFYTSADKQVDHLEGIGIVKNVLSSLKEAQQDPISVLTRDADFFGDPLDKCDSTLARLLQFPSDRDTFVSMTSVCLSAITAVIERQYKQYLELVVTDELRKETETARPHNIDSEEIMGMFSAAQHRAPNATLCFMSSRMRAQKNHLVEYLDKLTYSKKEKIIYWAVGMARKKRQNNRQSHMEMRRELSRRAALKRQKKDQKERKAIENKLKVLDLSLVASEFPELEENSISAVTEILSGALVGRNICHVWFDSDSGEKTVYSGRVEKLKKKKKGTYVIAYWGENESYEDAVDFEMSVYELAADFVCQDLTLS